MTDPTPIPYETRQAASKALCEMADRMMRGAQILMRKSHRMLNPGVEIDRRFIMGLRNYIGTGLPCGDEIPQVEALLRGVPEEECRSEYEKKLRKRGEVLQKWRDNSQRSSNEEGALRDQVREALAVTRGGQPFSAAERTHIALVLQRFVDGLGSPVPKPMPQRDGNVIHGAWGDAS